MHITDIQGISEPIRRLAEWAQNEYTGMGPGSANDISVTSVLTPAKIIALRRAYEWTLQADLTEIVPLLIGQSVHLLAHHSTGMTDNVRLQGTIADDHGNLWTIHGSPDYVRPRSPKHDKMLVQDFKVSKVRAIRDGVSPEWRHQLDLYAWLLDPMGVGDIELENIVLLTDWNKFRKKAKNYPQEPIVRLPVIPDDRTYTELLLKRRLTALAEALAQPLDKVPDCTPAETWDGRRCERCEVRWWCSQWQNVSHADEDDPLF